MAIKPIVTIPNKVLSTKTAVVGKIDKSILELVQDLKDTLKNAKEPEGAGLAANQIGVGKKVCVVRNFIENPSVKDGYEVQEFVLINPKIIEKSDVTEKDWEGCLSVPNTYGQVPRSKKIKVEAQTVDGEWIKINAQDLFARVIQHEVDHLDGVLFTSRVIGKTLTENELDKLYE